MSILVEFRHFIKYWIFYNILCNNFSVSNFYRTLITHTLNYLNCLISHWSSFFCFSSQCFNLHNFCCQVFNLQFELFLYVQMPVWGYLIQIEVLQYNFLLLPGWIWGWIFTNWKILKSHFYLCFCCNFVWISSVIFCLFWNIYFPRLAVRVAWRQGWRLTKIIFGAVLPEFC